jgi:polyhydroxyalkanoate synthesis repressor PhaR
MSDQPMPNVIIKKYANRRLYNTETSSYITLEHLAAMVRENRDFKVVDAKTGEDITRSVLTQIIVEEESRGGQTMLPVNFLRQLISLYGDSVQNMVPQYLEASMDAFRTNQDQVRKAWEGAFAANPVAASAFGNFEKLAEQNLAMMRKATEMFAPKKPVAPEPAADRTADDIAVLKAQLAAMQHKIDKLAGE